MFRHLMIPGIVCFALGSVLAVGKSAEIKASVKSLPPVVIKTFPVAGDTQVDATQVKEIQVTFSKTMQDKSWSWVQSSKETYPKGGDPRFEQDHRTAVLPVQLERGRTYVIWVNTEKFGNFRDEDGHSGVPYLLAFETKP